MNIVARNPYRIIGVFANDPVRVRTANLGKIRAFSKVNKAIHFKTDLQDFLGAFSRNLEDADWANAQLTDKTESAIIAFFWFHNNSIFQKEQIKDLGLDNYLKVVKDQSSLGEYSGFINSAVISLIEEDYESAVKWYSIVIESGTLIESFRDELEFPKNLCGNKELIQKFIKRLVDEYPDVDWWPLFLQHSHKRTVLNYIKSVFEDIAIEIIKEKIEFFKTSSNSQDKTYLQLAQQLKKETICCVKVLEPLEDGKKSAGAQLVLDSLSDELIRECSHYYDIAKYENEQSVLPTLQMTRYALSLACSSETIKHGTDFQKGLERDASKLPPKEVLSEDKAIKDEIRIYCQKPDLIRWALSLVRNCVPHLLKLKETLGTENSYYLDVSTKIADNAIYNSNAEIKSALMAMDSGKNGQDEATHDFENTLKMAWKLYLNLCELDLNNNFRNTKLKDNELYVKNLLDKAGVSYVDVMADITLLTDDDAFNRCNDYESLSKFCRQYPESKHFQEAIQKIWKIENDDFPSVITAKNLLRYKEKYPASHRDTKVLEWLNRFLLGTEFGTIYDYRQFLRFYPNHDKKEEILRRIDSLSFHQCKTIDDFKQYLADFKNGAYRETAIRKIDDELYARCETLADYNHYILQNPEGLHYQDALDCIEDLIYKSVCETKRYDEYLMRYPIGKHSSEIRTQQEYAVFKSCHSIDDYKSYLKRYPQGQYSELAKRAIQKKEKFPFLVGGIIIVLLVLIFFILSVASPSNKGTVSTAQETETPSQQTTPCVNDTPSDYSAQEENDNSNPQMTEEEQWGENRLKTGEKPYSGYFGKSKTGSNYIVFKTSGDCDYVIIVKRASDAKYMNHVYINGGDNAKLYLPNGHYYVYFYSGKGWNPYKVKGRLQGGFVSKESQQKDGPVELIRSWGEYTLYPVSDGNLRLSSADEEEIFD